jgi:hypothetical protein
MTMRLLIIYLLEKFNLLILIPLSHNLLLLQASIEPAKYRFLDNFLYFPCIRLYLFLQLLQQLVNKFIFDV